MNINFTLENYAEINSSITDFFEKASTNLRIFLDEAIFKIEAKLNGGMTKKVIIQLLIEKITLKESGEERKLDAVGQGIQRLIIVSVLKSYLDVLKKEGKMEGKKILILFEEPEVFLHPKLKRILNAVLEEISEQEDHQVLISTHDPYFTFASTTGDQNDANNKTMKKISYSFFKENSETKRSEEGIIQGIEDKLLFIKLYSMVNDKKILKDATADKEWRPRPYYKENREEEHRLITYIRHQIHHKGDNPATLGLIISEDYADKKLKVSNYYTEKELQEAIKIMCKIISAEEN